MISPVGVEESSPTWEPNMEPDWQHLLEDYEGPGVDPNQLSLFDYLYDLQNEIRDV